MELSNTRITPTHTISMNVWGEHSFQVSFPKEIAFEGTIPSHNFIAATVTVSVEYLDRNNLVASSSVGGSVVGNTIRLGKKAVKGNVSGNYKGQDLMLVLRNRKGQLIHKQPLNKAVKIKDVGHCKG